MNTLVDELNSKATINEKVDYLVTYLMTERNKGIQKIFSVIPEIHTIYSPSVENSLIQNMQNCNKLVEIIQGYNIIQFSLDRVFTNYFLVPLDYLCENYPEEYNSHISNHAEALLMIWRINMKVRNYVPTIPTIDDLVTVVNINLHNFEVFCRKASKSEFIYLIINFIEYITKSFPMSFEDLHYLRFISKNIESEYFYLYIRNSSNFASVLETDYDHDEKNSIIIGYILFFIRILFDNIDLMRENVIVKNIKGYVMPFDIDTYRRKFLEKELSRKEKIETLENFIKAFENSISIRDTFKIINYYLLGITDNTEEFQKLFDMLEKDETDLFNICKIYHNYTELEFDFTPEHFAVIKRILDKLINRVSFRHFERSKNIYKTITMREEENSFFHQFVMYSLERVDLEQSVFILTRFVKLSASRLSDEKLKEKIEGILDEIIQRYQTEVENEAFLSANLNEYDFGDDLHKVKVYYRIIKKLFDLREKPEEFPQTIDFIKINWLLTWRNKYDEKKKKKSKEKGDKKTVNDKRKEIVSQINQFNKDMITQIDIEEAKLFVEKQRQEITSINSLLNLDYDLTNTKASLAKLWENFDLQMDYVTKKVIYMYFILIKRLGMRFDPTYKEATTDKIQETFGKLIYDISIKFNLEDKVKLLCYNFLKFVVITSNMKDAKSRQKWFVRLIEFVYEWKNEENIPLPVIDTLYVNRLRLDEKKFYDKIIHGTYVDDMNQIRNLMIIMCYLFYQENSTQKGIQANIFELIKLSCDKNCENLAIESRFQKRTAFYNNNLAELKSMWTNSKQATGKKELLFHSNYDISNKFSDNENIKKVNYFFNRLISKCGNNHGLLYGLLFITKSIYSIVHMCDKFTYLLIIVNLIDFSLQNYSTYISQPEEKMLFDLKNIIQRTLERHKSEKQAMKEIIFEKFITSPYRSDGIKMLVVPILTGIQQFFPVDMETEDILGDLKLIFEIVCDFTLAFRAGLLKQEDIQTKENYFSNVKTGKGRLYLAYFITYYNAKVLNKKKMFKFPMKLCKIIESNKRLSQEIRKEICEYMNENKLGCYTSYYS